MRSDSVFKYLSYRLYPSASQRRRLEASLEACRRLANTLLAERVAAHQAGDYLGLGAQLRRVTVLRREDPLIGDLHSHTAQLMATAVDRSWRDWLRAGRRG